MIQVTNIKSFEGVPFNEYLQHEGYSHSFLKYQRFGIVEPVEVTKNMQIGSLVDGIITEPEKVNMSDELYYPARSIAKDLKAQYGDMLNVFKKQVSYSATFTMGEFELQTKGRLDFFLTSHAVIDLKVTWSKDVVALINYMGYKNQVWGYCKMAGVKKAYIMIYSVPLRKSFLYEIAIEDRNEFWENQLLDFGVVKSCVSC